MQIVLERSLRGSKHRLLEGRLSLRVWQVHTARIRRCAREKEQKREGSRACPLYPRGKQAVRMCTLHFSCACLLANNKTIIGTGFSFDLKNNADLGVIFQTWLSPMEGTGLA